MTVKYTEEDFTVKYNSNDRTYRSCKTVEVFVARTYRCASTGRRSFFFFFSFRFFTIH